MPLIASSWGSWTAAQISDPINWEPITKSELIERTCRLSLVLTAPEWCRSDTPAEYSMRPKDHQLPETGPASNPILFGVAHGLSEIFPPIKLSSTYEETDDQIVDLAMLADGRSEASDLD